MIIHCKPGRLIRPAKYLSSLISLSHQRDKGEPPFFARSRAALAVTQAQARVYIQCSVSYSRAAPRLSQRKAEEAVRGRARRLWEEEKEKTRASPLAFDIEMGIAAKRLRLLLLLLLDFGRSGRTAHATRRKGAPF